MLMWYSWRTCWCCCWLRGRTVRRFWIEWDIEALSEGKWTKENWKCDLDRLKGLVLNVVQSSSSTRSPKALKDIQKGAEELKQDSTKRNVPAKEDIITEVKKLKQGTIEDFLSDEKNWIKTQILRLIYSSPTLAFLPWGIIWWLVLIPVIMKTISLYRKESS